MNKSSIFDDDPQFQQEQEGQSVTQAVESESGWDEPWQESSGAQSNASSSHVQDAEFSEQEVPKPKTKVLPVVIAVVAFSSAAAFMGYQILKPKNQGSASAAMSFPQPQIQPVEQPALQAQAGGVSVNISGNGAVSATMPMTLEEKPQGGNVAVQEKEVGQAEQLSLNTPASTVPVAVPVERMEKEKSPVSERVERLEDGMRLVIAKVGDMEGQVRALAQVPEAVPVERMEKEKSPVSERVERLEDGMRLVIAKVDDMEGQVRALAQVPVAVPVERMEKEKSPVSERVAQTKNAQPQKDAPAVKPKLPESDPVKGVPKKKTKLASRAAKPVDKDNAGRFGLLGAIAEQAWIEDRATQKVTVVYVGDILPGGEKVVRIDPVKSVVKTSRGSIQSD